MLILCLSSNFSLNNCIRSLFFLLSIFSTIIALPVYMGWLLGKRNIGARCIELKQNLASLYKACCFGSISIHKRWSLQINIRFVCLPDGGWANRWLIAFKCKREISFKWMWLNVKKLSSSNKLPISFIHEAFWLNDFVPGSYSNWIPGLH